METKPDEPINCNNGNGYWNDEKNHTHTGRGLTKREYFAALILQGMLANPTGIDNRITFAVQCADILIEELNKPKTDEGNG